MFTLIKLLNFKCFREISFKLAGAGGRPKHMAIIYGPNGSGKSALLSSFRMLGERTLSLSADRELRKLMKVKMKNNVFDNTSVAVWNSICALKNDLEDYRTHGSADTMTAEFNFVLDGRPGYYVIKENEDGIVYEQLDFEIRKKKGTCFKISPGSIVINSRAFDNAELRNHLEACINRHWGEHTFLAILFDELRRGNLDEYKHNMVQSQLDVLDFFASLAGQQDFRLSDNIEIPKGTLPFFEEGRIAIKDELLLEKSAKILSSFLPRVNANIKSVYYRKERDGNHLRFELRMKEKLDRNLVDISGRLESLGTKQAIKVLNAFQLLARGKVVILDEFESNLHENVMSRILEEAAPLITGQLICTTHMTMLLDGSLDRKSFYVVDQCGGKKEIKCIMDCKDRTYSKNSPRSKYLTNRYGGLPPVTRYGFEELARMVRTEKGM